MAKGGLTLIIHDLLSVELLDVEYYRNLEMWVRGHSRSLKLVPIESLGAISYFLLYTVFQKMAPFLFL